MIDDSSAARSFGSGASRIDNDRLTDAAYPASGDIGTDETGRLISSDKVSGTAVYNRSEERLGTIDSLMIDKRSGKVVYAVMSFGGFLGIGERYHPLPWNQLDYDTGIDGYRVDLSADRLTGAPSYSRDELGSWDGSRRGEEVTDYYDPDRTASLSVTGATGYGTTGTPVRTGSTDADADRVVSSNPTGTAFRN